MNKPLGIDEETELLACPFCGGPGKLFKVPGGAILPIAQHKPECPVRVEAPYYLTEREAVAAWNTRALSRTSPSVDAIPGIIVSAVSCEAEPMALPSSPSIEKLREALEPFARAAEPIMSNADFDVEEWSKRVKLLKVGDFKRVHNALNSIPSLNRSSGLVEK